MEILSASNSHMEATAGRITWFNPGVVSQPSLHIFQDVSGAVELFLAKLGPPTLRRQRNHFREPVDPEYLLAVCLGESEYYF